MLQVQNYTGALVVVRESAMPEQSNDYRVVVFGAGGVGKSSLVLRFVRGTFRDTYVPTIEDTYRQVISCNKQVCTSLFSFTFVSLLPENGEIIHHIRCQQL